MADLKYVVDVDLNVDQGVLGGKLDRIGGAAKGLGDSFFKVGGRLADGLEGALDKAVDVTATVGKIGAAGAVAGVTWGLTLNKSLEETKISLASILQASGNVGTIGEGMERAGGLMAKLRQDAAALPGTFEDLVGIFRSISTPALASGVNVDNVAKFAEQGMAAGAVMGLRSDMVGRELAQLFSGRAGAHNIFGARLGLIGAEAEAFNKMSAADRNTELTLRLGKYKDAIDAFGTSYAALSTTFMTNTRKFASDATAPLFEKIKGTLGDINSWIDANPALLSRWAGQVGDFLANTFDRGKSIILEYGPDFLRFAENAKNAFVDVWKSAEPYMKAFGDYLHSFLKDDAAIDKLITLAKVWGAMKVGGSLSGLLGGLGTGAGGAGGGFGGALGAAGGALQLGAAGFAAGTLAGSPMAAGMLGGGLAGARLGFGAAGAPGAAIGASVGVAAGGIVELFQASKQLKDADVAYDMTLLSGAKDVRDSTGMIDTSGRAFSEILQSVTDSASILDRVFGDVAGSMQTAAMKLNALAVQTEMQVMAQKQAAEIGKKIDDALNQFAGTGKRVTEAELKAREKRGAAGRGSGGTVIHKVEISVSTNQNPGQVARQVGAYLAHDSRFRTSSPYTRSFTAPS